MFPDFDHAVTVAVHAIYALTGLGEDKLVNTALTNLTFETVGVIWIVSSHDCLVQNREMADVATVRAICTYWRTIGEKKKVGVGGHLITTFRAFEAIDMEKGLAVKKRLADCKAHTHKRAMVERLYEVERTQKPRRGLHAL
jgi:hypothetical protein